MKHALIIVTLAGIAVALVHIRRAEDHLRHEVEALRLEENALRKELAEQQIRLGELTAPETLRRRVDATALELQTERRVRRTVAGRDVTPSRHP